MWSFLGTEESASLQAGGFYTTVMADKLRFIGMNSQYGDSLNFWLYAKNGSPGGPNQTEWLTSTLEAARNSGERVIIASHIPCLHSAGVHDFYCSWVIDLIEEYQDIISLVLAGHTHTDEWVTLNDAAVQYVSPSVTPFSHKNPAFRLFGLTDEWEAVQVQTYYLDLGEANEKGTAEWKLEYTLPDAYGMPDLSPASFDAVAKSLLTNATRFAQWSKYFECSMTNSTYCDTPKCQLDIYCRLTSPLASEYAQCLSNGAN